MIKRPLVFLTLGYLLGILMGSSELQLLLFPLSVILFLILWFLKKSHSKDIFLYALPWMVLLGMLRVQAAGEINMPENCIDGEYCGITGKVLSRTGENRIRLVVDVREIGCDTQKASQKPGKMLVYIGDAGKTEGESERLIPGSMVQLKGTICELEQADNPGQFDEKSYYKAQGICAKLYADSILLCKDAGVFKKGLWQVKCRLMEVYQSILPAEKAGVLDAMLLAEKSMLDSDMKEAYRKAGISHILVVSGAHISLLGYGVYRLLTGCRAGVNSAVFAVSGLLVMYGVFVGAGIPVIRALVMFLLALWAKIFGRTYDPPTGLALAAVIVLLRQPLQLFQAGFLLSFGAVAAILLLTPYLKEMGFGFLAASIAIQLFLFPVMLWFYYEVPVYSLVLNLFVLPFLSLVLILAVLAGIVGCIGLGAGRFFAGGIYAVLNLYEMVGELNEHLPGHSYCPGRPEFWRVILFYVGIAVCCACWSKWIRQKRAKRRHIWIVVLCFAVLLLPGKSEWRATWLSVGQADCAVLQRGDMTMVMDMGSQSQNGAENILEPFFKYYGDTVLEYVFLSHADVDHCRMLLDILQQMLEEKAELCIENLVLAKAAGDTADIREIAALAENAGVRVVWMCAGDRIDFDDLTLTCLYPGEEKETDAENNELSMVLLAQTEKTCILYTGDIGEAEEIKVIQRLRDMHWDAGGRTVILKTAHHGSRYSSCTEFLEAVSTNASDFIAVISCGERNRYGHPHGETINRLEATGSKILRTDELGAIILTISSSGEVERKGYRQSVGRGSK